jgi:transposase-like protein
VVLELLSGAASPAELCRKYEVNANLLANWKAAVVERLPSVFGVDSAAGPDPTRIAELEQLVGQQALELTILKKASRLLNGPSHRNGRSS